jgi:hypothetical protein
MISAFFIRRPIFACVIAIVIMLGGVLALNTLSISQYPEIAPPTIQISASYPGADAQTVENSVTKIIEQGMTGLDNLDYMTATSTSTGQAEITLTFTNKANPDTAQMQVQNKLQLVTALLPSMVQSTGLTVTKSSSDFPMVIGFVSTDGRMTEADLSDYVKSALNDTLKRVEGVGNTQLFGCRLCHADLARPGQARQICPDASRCGGRDPIPEYASLRGSTRWPARTDRAAAQRHGYGAKSSANAGAVSQYYPQEYRRRLAGAHQ